jgi:hypothetical protein
VDTIFIVVAAVVDMHDDCIEHRVNLFALADVFVFCYDDYRLYLNLNKLLEKMCFRTESMKQSFQSFFV